MTEQEDIWRGVFGDEYLERNRIDPQSRLGFWKHIAKRTCAESAFELGCSRGHNLLSLRECGVKYVSGIDINEKAVRAAREHSLPVMVGPLTDLEWMSSEYDLAFTAGVLIHVPPSDIDAVLFRIKEISREWVLAVEYEDDVEVNVTYRGMKNALWRRPYGRMYHGLGLDLWETGKLDATDGFDNCTYWLLRKR